MNSFWAGNNSRKMYFNPLCCKRAQDKNKSVRSQKAARDRVGIEWKWNWNFHKNTRYLFLLDEFGIELVERLTTNNWWSSLKRTIFTYEWTIKTFTLDTMICMKRQSEVFSLRVLVCYRNHNSFGLIFDHQGMEKLSFCVLC
jgi:hypothetical protein